MTGDSDAAMRGARGVERVIVIPLSGYVNRLQAMASSAILARQLGAEFLVCWQRQSVADVPVTDVLDPAFCADHVITDSRLHDISGLEPSSVPRYLNRVGDVLTLAGHDRGEQVFMRDLAMQCESATPPKTLVIRAGGKFFLPDHLDAGRFRERRHEWYQSMPVHPAVVSAASEVGSQHPESLGLHLRYTDRSHQTPTRGRIRQAVQRIAQRTGRTQVLIASDTHAKRIEWTTRLRHMGLDPWIVEHDAVDRGSVAGAHSALVDFLLLRGTLGMVYFTASSFGEEAAVASMGFADSIGLQASASVAAWSRARTLIDAAVTYPSRHGWRS